MDEEDDFDATLKEFGIQDEGLCMRMDEDFDYAYALMLQLLDTDSSVKRNCNEKESSSSSSLKKPLSVVDQEWEVIDPNPNIHTLFQQFNAEYFWGVLESVEVRWSPRMTQCAGVCCYEGRGGLCSVRLSQPLLKFRPRRDLVETLLHEMIHAFLFVTNNNKDHDGHGPEFLKHMKRLNEQTGARISVYHNFHDEVDYQRQHWWKCNGPCQYRKPYFGIVKRAMNRAPSANDLWWNDHKTQCGGSFVKIKQPENFGQKKTLKRKAPEACSSKPQSKDIKNFFNKTPPVSKKPPTVMAPNLEGSKKSNVSGVLPLPPVQDVAKSLHSTNGRIHTVSSPIQKTKEFVPFSGTGYSLGGTSLHNGNCYTTAREGSKCAKPSTSYRGELMSREKTQGASKSNFRSNNGTAAPKTYGGSLLTRTPSGSKTIVLNKKTHATGNDTGIKGPVCKKEIAFTGEGNVLDGASASSGQATSPPTKVTRQKPLADFFPRTPQAHKQKIVFSSDSEDDVVKKVGNSVVSKKTDNGNPSKITSERQPTTAPCPVCGTHVNLQGINAHLDACLNNS